MLQITSAQHCTIYFSSHLRILTQLSTCLLEVHFILGFTLTNDLHFPIFSMESTLFWRCNSVDNSQNWNMLAVCLGMHYFDSYIDNNGRWSVYKPSNFPCINSLSFFIFISPQIWELMALFLFACNCSRLAIMNAKHELLVSLYHLHVCIKL